MNFIDSEIDHLDRPVDPKHVWEMAMKAVIGADGRRVPNPTFSKTVYPSEHTNCICGKRIIYNYLACCVETGKAFIVGSECINNVCFDNVGFTLELKCAICDETIVSINDGSDAKEKSLASGRKQRCVRCAKMFRRRNNKVRVGKYEDELYKNMLSKPCYIALMRAETKLDEKFSTLLEWLDYVERYPELLKDEPPTAEPDLRPENTLWYEPEPVVPTGSSMLPFGKHRGKTFDHVLANEPDYCRWVLGADSPTGALKEFQDWLKTRKDSLSAAISASATAATATTAVAPHYRPATAFRFGSSAPTGSSMLSFGKHKGRTYADMLAKEPEYCGWVQDKDSPTGPLKEFQEWLNAQ